jgi:hypothetical protein
MTWRGDVGGVRVCGRLCHRLWTARVFRDGVARVESSSARPRYKVKFGVLRTRIARNRNNLLCSDMYHNLSSAIELMDR